MSERVSASPPASRSVHGNPRRTYRRKVKQTTVPSLYFTSALDTWRYRSTEQAVKLAETSGMSKFQEKLGSIRAAGQYDNVANPCVSHYISSSEHAPPQVGPRSGMVSKICCWGAQRVSRNPGEPKGGRRRASPGQLRPRKQRFRNTCGGVCSKQLIKEYPDDEFNGI